MTQYAVILWDHDAARLWFGILAHALSPLFLHSQMGMRSQKAWAEKAEDPFVPLRRKISRERCFRPAALHVPHTIRSAFSTASGARSITRR